VDISQIYDVAFQLLFQFPIPYDLGQSKPL